MAYKWNGKHFNVSANDVGAIFERIEQENGVLTPELIVAEAENEDSILHDLFTWDKDKAFYEYHLIEAQHIRRCLVVEKEIPEERIVEIRAFPNVSTETKGVYVNVSRAIETEEYRNAMLVRALHEMQMYMAKYSMLNEINDLVNKDALNSIKEKLGM